jgi:hypothetical protein
LRAAYRCGSSILEWLKIDNHAVAGRFDNALQGADRRLRAACSKSGDVALIGVEPLCQIALGRPTWRLIKDWDAAQPGELPLDNLSGGFGIDSISTSRLSFVRS